MTPWISGVLGTKLTLNTAPPAGSTLVGMLSPASVVTRISRLPSPASDASTVMRGYNEQHISDTCEYVRTSVGGRMQLLLVTNFSVEHEKLC